MANHELLVKNNNESKSDKGKISFPYKIQDVEKKTNSELLDLFTGEKTGFVLVGPKKFCLTSSYRREADNYYNFSTRPDDVIVNTFPRSGTTLAQEMVWLLSNDLDYKKATEIPLVKRFPFFEYSSIVHSEIKEMILKENEFDEDNCKLIHNMYYPGWKYLHEMTERRFIKTHLPFSLLPPTLLKTGCKVIYIARNPKDVAVSYYHLCRTYRARGFIGDFAQFWKYFQEGLVLYSPYWEHIKEGWSQRHEKNVLFLFYEDMNKNLKPVIEKVSNFLGKQYSDEEISLLEDHLKIENFRKNKSVNSEHLKEMGFALGSEENFVRKGKSGGWRSYFDDELNAVADKWIEEHLKSFDIQFPIVQ